MKYATAITAAAIVSLASATPTPVQKRADTCGQWDSVQTGPYTVYNNLWGRDAATSGSQCFGVDGLNGNSVAWHASWTWQGGQYNVKSYPNVVVDSRGQQISAISSMQSTWTWTYTSDNLVANVAYDVFTSSTADGSEEFEIMIWLAALGGAGPISSSYGADGNAVPVATPSVAGQSWRLYEGKNNQMTVFSFVATSTVNDFSGDLMSFLNYLISNQGYSGSQYLLSAGAGTEPFTGSNAVFKTSAYSISVN